MMIGTLKSKNMKTLIISSILIVSFSFPIFSQNTVIQEAMKEEIERNKNDLSLEGLKSPFYISYIVSDAKTLKISASLGALISSSEMHYRKPYIRTLVGNNKQTNENYEDINSVWSYTFLRNIVLEDVKDVLKIGFWNETDRKYKKAAERYARKSALLKQQNLSEEDRALYDFSETKPVKISIKNNNLAIDQSKWETYSKEISKVFLEYKEIHGSEVLFNIFNSQVYFLDTDDSEATFPLTIISLRIKAKTQANDGDRLSDELLYYVNNLNGVPDIEKVKSDIKELAGSLINLKSLKGYNDAYAGPVLFEGQAVAEIISQLFFNNATGLIAKRKPIIDKNAVQYVQNTENRLELRINKKVISRELSVISETNSKNSKYIGKSAIDAEGVVPDEKLALIENGVLKSFLSDRTPSLKQSKSNGHKRFVLSDGGLFPDVGPGIIRVTSNKPVTMDTLKQRLMKKAKEEDLDYALIVRKIKNNNSGFKNESSENNFEDGENYKPILVYVYKINLSDGKEELIRSIDLSRISISSLKRILGVTDEAYVYNTLMKSKKHRDRWWQDDSWNLNGIPTTFIVPNGILFEELELFKMKKAIKELPPIVENPIN